MEHDRTLVTQKRQKKSFQTLELTTNKRELTFTGPLQYTIGQTDPDVYPDTDTDKDTDTDTDTDVYPDTDKDTDTDMDTDVYPYMYTYTIGQTWSGPVKVGYLTFHRPPPGPYITIHSHDVSISIITAIIL